MKLPHLLPSRTIHQADVSLPTSFESTQPFQKIFELYKIWLDPIQGQYFTVNLLLDGAVRINRIYEEHFPRV
jgi:hypothetical protein